jgi:hypothetical protein
MWILRFLAGVMDAQTIDTLALIRQIRDDHYRCLEGKTHAERIAFYREQAQKMRGKIAALLQQEPFDYTKWQRNLWSDKSIEEISHIAMQSRQSAAIDP